MQIGWSPANKVEIRHSHGQKLAQGSPGVSGGAEGGFWGGEARGPGWGSGRREWRERDEGAWQERDPTWEHLPLGLWAALGVTSGPWEGTSSQPA